MRSMTEIEARAELKTQHDIIKSHPFRVSYDPKWERDYIHCLYKLSDIWGKYAYFGAHETDEKKRLMRQSGYWLHNYNQQLLGRRFPMEYVGYYEQMLQVIHMFVDTGELPRFFDIDYLWKNGQSYRGVERYELITQEMCGIDSPILPRYFPTNYTIKSNVDDVRQYINNDFHYRNMTEEQKEEHFKRWVKEVKPVLDWINGRHEETELQHSVWVAAVKSFE